MATKESDISLAEIQQAASGNYDWAFNTPEDTSPVSDEATETKEELAQSDNSTDAENISKSGELSDNTVVNSPDGQTGEPDESDAANGEQPVTSVESEGNPQGQAESNEPEWFKALPPQAQQEYLDAINRARHAQAKLNSMEGRVRSHQDLTRKHSQATQELRELKKRLEESKQHQPQTIEEWKQLAEQEPLLAKAIEGFVNQRLSSSETALTERLVNIAEPLNEGREQDVIASEMSRLDAMVGTPEWRSWVETPEWHAWKAQQPPAIQNAMLSNNADDALPVLRMFYMDMQQAYSQMQASGQVPATPTQAAPVAAQTSPANTPPVVQVDKIVARRQQAQASPSVVQGRAPATSGLSNIETEKAEFERLLRENIKARMEGREPVVS